VQLAILETLTVTIAFLHADMYKGVPSTKAVELAPQFSREEASRVKVDTLKQVGFNSNLASLTSRSVSSKLLDVAGADPKVVDQRNARVLQ
jgi:hypothetical protein